MRIGDKIKVCGEVQRYTVQAFDERHVVMTKPFNARKTYLYSIVDLERKWRGPIGLVFGLPIHVNSPEGAAELLSMMNDEGFQVSRRHGVDLTENELRQLATHPSDEGGRDA
jgi:hypothetical protein